jgi:GT2 family glycosyltransferase
LAGRGYWGLRRRFGAAFRKGFALIPTSPRTRALLKRSLFTAGRPFLRNTWAYQNWLATEPQALSALIRPALLNAATPPGSKAPPQFSPRVADSSSLPDLDISIVTHNSQTWLEGFFESLAGQDYPTRKIGLYIADNASTDDTVGKIHSLIEIYGNRFRHVSISERRNDGFGGGHNHNAERARASYLLITNVDLKIEGDTLLVAMNAAVRDPDDIAAWELRQKPYEHSKYYDPVSLETSWCSAACLLVRLASFRNVGGFDDRIFMYGEDVELSYRLRDRGYRLRYLPRAAVWHYTYEHEGKIKPLQYIRSMLANSYLRLRYGSLINIAAIPLMYTRAFSSPGLVPNHRKLIAGIFGRFLWHAPHFLLRRKRSAIKFGFVGWDYEMRREGDFHAFAERPGRPTPCVSIVVRTYAGRGALLREAVASIVNQTYANIELLVVEDGGDEAAAFVNSVRSTTGLNARHIAAPKRGRSHTGNIGLAAASGEYMMFLDDDDQLFADHVDVLIDAIISSKKLAAYALSWQVETEFLADDIKAEHRFYVPKSHRFPYSRDVLGSTNFIPIQSIIFHRELYDRQGGFFEHIDALEDWNLWLRYSQLTDFHFVAKITSLYRVPADEGVRKKRSEHMQGFYEIARTAGLENGSSITRVSDASQLD